MIARRVLPLLLLALSPLGPAQAQRVMDVGRGDPDRRALMDAIRPIFERDTFGPVEFAVRELRRFGDYAYGVIQPQRPGGRPIRWQDTNFRGQLDPQQWYGGRTYVLWHRQPAGWKVEEYAVNPTDVVWIEWQRRRNLPEALFTTERMR